METLTWSYPPFSYGGLKTSMHAPQYASPNSKHIDIANFLLDTFGF